MNILIIGESCVDRTYVGSCHRICPEGPVPVFSLKDTHSTSGMAGNVFSNIENLRPKYNTNLITSQETPIKNRFVDEVSGQLLLRVDESDTINTKLEVNDDIKSLIEQQDAIVVSDYNKGFLDENILSDISSFALSKDIPTFIDTKKQAGPWCDDFSFIKINEKEFLENGWKDYESLFGKIIVTRGSSGCSCDGVNYPTEKVNVRDVTGAGDTFLAAFTIKWLESGGNIKKSIDFAQECCKVVIQKQGVAVVNEQF